MDLRTVKLGKKAARFDKRTLKLSDYTANLPPSPVNAGWTRHISNLGMMLNDQLGDCTCAAAGHSIQTWTAASLKQTIPSDQTVLRAYEISCGYVPGDPNTDQGGVELDVLTDWRKGKIFSSNPISAFVSINPKNKTEVRDAVWLFGGAYIGVLLPITAQNQPDVWSVVSNAGSNGDPGSWGGHAIPIVGYGDTGVTVISWGQLIKATWAFLAKYMDEAYCVLSKDWIKTNGLAPSGFNMAKLRADIKLIDEA